jgi:hypothetical protein
LKHFLAPEVVQTSAMDCGPASLKCMLEGWGIPVSYGRLREACQTEVDGSSIDTMEAVANQLGLEAEQIVLPPDHLLVPQAHALPCILVLLLWLDALQMSLRSIAMNGGLRQAIPWHIGLWPELIWRPATPPGAAISLWGALVLGKSAETEPYLIRSTFPVNRRPIGRSTAPWRHGVGGGRGPESGQYGGYLRRPDSREMG